MLQQLYHVGQHGDFDNSYSAHWSPSGLPSYHDADGSHAMLDAEIEEIIDGFVAAAVRAQRSGFDGVELFGAYNGLIEQFWLPWSNRRHDQWGGSLDNRMRFTREIIERTRRQVGEDFIIGLNASVDTGVEVALTIDALCEVAQWLDQRQLIDYLSCGTGGYFNFAELMPTFQFADKLGAPLAEALKKVVTHAKVQAESHIRTPENADYVIASGQADMVSIVRGQIADPHLANKARDGQADRVRGCISCNQMCWGRRSRDYWISCLVNPSAGREFEWGGDRFTRAAQARHILVVGGGPAGLEPPGWPPNAATASRWPRPARSLAAPSAWPACNRDAARFWNCWTGTNTNWRDWASTCGSTHRSMPMTSLCSPPMPWSWLPAPCPPAPASSASCRNRPFCPASTNPTSGRSRT